MGKNKSSRLGLLKRLDRYILRKFLSTFFFVALIFTLIAIVIDFSENIEEFIDEPVTVWQVARDYYLNFMLWINGLLWPLYALIAVIFFTSRMAYNSEIISMLSAGVSFRRILLPYLIGGGLLTLMHLLGNHFLIPYGNKTKLDFERSYIWKERSEGKNEDIHMFIGEGDKVYVRYFRRRDSTLLDFRLEHFEGKELKSQLKAKTAEWKGDSAGWSLRNYEMRTFDGLKETLLVGKGDRLDTLINLNPEDFVRYGNQKEMLATPELIEFIDLEKLRGLTNTRIYEIELYRRTADPLTILILTIIGLAVASRKVRGGMGLHLALGIAIGAIFIFLSRFSVTFATNQAIPAVLGVWLPNIVFSLIAFWLVLRAQR